MMKPLTRVSWWMCIASLMLGSTPALFAQPQFPQPVTEYAEKTAPNKMTFLSYPKYYRNADEQLVLVDTTLRPSDEADWDYEVETGIWQLKVRSDGTFQATHAGDSFTYRFNSLGIGRGNAFRAVDLGQPDFSNIEVNGDTIRWNEIFRDVDLELR